MNKESLVIGKNPDRNEQAIGFDPKQLGINAVERLLLSLVGTPGGKQVIAFGENFTLLLNREGLEATKSLSPHDQKERVNTDAVNIMLSNRAIVVIKTP